MAQALTATMVKEHANEMMNLLNKLQAEARKMIDAEVVSVAQR